MINLNRFKNTFFAGALFCEMAIFMAMMAFQLFLPVAFGTISSDMTFFIATVTDCTLGSYHYLLKYHHGSLERDDRIYGSCSI